MRPGDEVPTGGPDGTGLYHYTSATASEKKGVGVYAYSSVMDNRMDRVRSSGVRSVNSLNGPWRDVRSADLYNELANKGKINCDGPGACAGLLVHEGVPGQLQMPAIGRGGPLFRVQDAGVAAPRLGRACGEHQPRAAHRDAGDRESGERDGVGASKHVALNAMRLEGGLVGGQLAVRVGEREVL